MSSLILNYLKLLKYLIIVIRNFCGIAIASKVIFITIGSNNQITTGVPCLIMNIH